MELSTLITRRDQYTEKATSAALAGQLDRAKQYEGEANKAQEAIDLVGRVSALGGELPNGMSSNRPPLPMANKGMNTAVLARAAYKARFTNIDEATDQILTELNGANYEMKYHNQKAAFGSYLRRGEARMREADLGLLKEIVLPANLVKSMLAKDGIDSVATMKATMVESVDTLGGYIVPVDFQARVIERLQGMTVVRKYAQVDQTSRDKVEIPVATGGDDQYTSAVRVSWVEEKMASSAGETNLTFGSENISIYTMTAKTWVSRNLVEDAAFSIEDYLTRKFAEASAIDEDNKFLVGTGAGTPQGILPASTNALGLLEKNSGSAGALTWDGLISLYYGVKSQYRQRAAWIGESASYEAIMKLKNASNDYLWKPFQFMGGEEGQPVKLMNFNALEQEAMPSVAANAYAMLFGDLSGYQIFDRIGMSVERYLDSNTADKNTIMFMLRRRLGGQLVEPWKMVVQKVAA